MKLDFAQISHLRCLSRVDLNFSSGFNVFFGENGSGKTSLLEAIYFLCSAKSFRSHIARRVIQDSKKSVFVYGRGTRGGQPITVGIERSSTSHIQVKLNEVPVTRLSSLAENFPIIASGPDIDSLIDDSAARIKWIDWGLFHVEQFYFSYWKKMKNIHAQRNAALKSKGFFTTLDSWDELWFDVSCEISKYRDAYVSRVIDIYQQNSFFDVDQLNFLFYQGWNGSLKDVLNQSRTKDLFDGFTHYGPHRADLKISHRNIDAKHFLSRGQKKKIDFRLKVAQSIDLHKQSGIKSLLLIDDVLSEYDEQSLKALIEQLFSLGHQVFLTGIDCMPFERLLGKYPHKMFHVKHGVVEEISSWI